MSQASGEISVTVRALHALTSSGRMAVLKCLRTRRMTAAEVATSAKMRKSSAHKHLVRLATAGFVLRHDDDRVWVYYSLTPQGRHLVESERPRLVLLLAAAVILLTASLALLGLQARRWQKAVEAWDVAHVGPYAPSFWTPETIALASAAAILAAAVAMAVTRLSAARRRVAT